MSQEYLNSDRVIPNTDYVPAERMEFWDDNRQFLIAGFQGHQLADHLRRQLAFSSAITSNMAEGVYAVDQGGRITFVNPAAEVLLGLREADLLGTAAPTIMSPTPGPTGRFEKSYALRDVVQARETCRSDYSLFVRPDQTTLAVAYSAAPITTDDIVVGAVVTFHDVTEVQQLQQSQEEFLALLSHDLRTPLTALLGYAQHIEPLVKEQGTEQVITAIAAILRSGRRMNHLIQNGLDNSRLAAGHALLHIEAVDLVAVLTTSMAENILPQDCIRIETDAVADLPVMVDPLQIERVIVNLLSNALKYSPPGSPVLVRVFSAGQHAMISVADQGVGIDADELPHLFKKHYRARTAAATRGSGLGLYSSCLIVEAHGGRIWVQSEGGAGSTFWFSLPVSGPGFSEASLRVAGS